jgi:hypothetical protein
MRIEYVTVAVVLEVTVTFETLTERPFANEDDVSVRTAAANALGSWSSARRPAAGVEPLKNVVHAAVTCEAVLAEDGGVLEHPASTTPAVSTVRSDVRSRARRSGERALPGCVRRVSGTTREGEVDVHDMWNLLGSEVTALRRPHRGAPGAPWRCILRVHRRDHPPYHCRLGVSSSTTRAVRRGAT